MKHIFQYLIRTWHLRLHYTLHYTRSANPTLIRYADAIYRCDRATSKSFTSYVFYRHYTAISSKLVKQTIFATSSNHLEVITLYEASREYIWITSVDGFILRKLWITI